MLGPTGAWFWNQVLKLICWDNVSVCALNKLFDIYSENKSLSSSLDIGKPVHKSRAERGYHQVRISLWMQVLITRVSQNSYKLTEIIQIQLDILASQLCTISQMEDKPAWVGLLKRQKTFLVKYTLNQFLLWIYVQYLFPLNLFIFVVSCFLMQNINYVDVKFVSLTWCHSFHILSLYICFQ